MKTKTVQLGVKDRLVLIGTLPTEGSFIDLKVIQGLKDELMLTEDEKTTLKVVQQGNGILWDLEVAKSWVVEFVLTEAAFALVVKTLIDMDKRNHLTLDHVKLYELFVMCPNANQA